MYYIHSTRSTYVVTSFPGPHNSHNYQTVQYRTVPVVAYISMPSLQVINVFFYIMLLYQVANYYNERTYLLLSDKNMFQFYIGDKLAQESHYHNIYIRLAINIHHLFRYVSEIGMQ